MLMFVTLNYTEYNNIASFFFIYLEISSNSTWCIELALCSYAYIILTKNHPNSFIKMHVYLAFFMCILNSKINSTRMFIYLNNFIFIRCFKHLLYGIFSFNQYRPFNFICEVLSLGKVTVSQRESTIAYWVHFIHNEVRIL